MSTTIHYASLSFLGFPHYRVGDDGSVWSCRVMPGNGKARPHLTKPWVKMRGLPPKHNKGYQLYAMTHRDGRCQRIQGHRLVLLAFVGPCPEGMEPCHFNGIRDDNRLENLRWDTLKNNAADKRRHGTMPIGERNVNAKMTSQKVNEVRQHYETGSWVSQRAFCREMAASYGVSHNTLRAILRGYWWRHVL